MVVDYHPSRMHNSVVSAKLPPSGLNPARVALVIVDYRIAFLTVECLRLPASERAKDATFNVIVADGHSADGEQLEREITDNGWQAWATGIIAELNGGFAYGDNLGIEAALAWELQPEYFLLLNPDTEVRSGAVRELVAF